MSDQPARILLVDDERLLLLAMVRYLHLGRPAWEVLTALDGAEAMATLRSRPVDLLVSDIQMPGMDGLTLLAEVRRDPALEHLPLIFVTGLGDRATMRLGMATGADDYLTKPFTAEELILAIEGRLRRKAQGAQGSGAARELREHLGRLLTERELEVLMFIGRGLVTKEIAADLGLSPRTVSVHRANLMRKLDLHNAAALAALAMRASGV